MVIIIFHTLPLYLQAGVRKQLILLNRLSLQFLIWEMLSKSLRPGSDAELFMSQT